MQQLSLVKSGVWSSDISDFSSFTPDLSADPNCIFQKFCAQVFPAKGQDLFQTQTTYGQGALLHSSMLSLTIQSQLLACGYFRFSLMHNSANFRTPNSGKRPPCSVWCVIFKPFSLPTLSYNMTVEKWM